MKKLVNGLILGLLMFFVQLSVQAQTGSISGTVVDQNGAVIPGASVTVKGTAGQVRTVTTSGNGTYTIPAVENGIYTVTVTSPNFKTSITSNVKVDVGTPATVDVSLEAGKIEETVLVVSGGEVLQTQTATVGTTITGRQITETPIQSRDALDLVTTLPGTNTVGTVRTSSINGLPKGAISITIDGVDVQDNYLRSSDGFFTYVRPRIDAIDEVTVSTAVPGSEATGDGAVRVQFATRRGTNDYSGGLYWQHRDESLNANYWQNNRAGLPRGKIRLNQFGGRVGGPIPFFNFGDGGPWWHSGKDRAFFFVNYEEYRIPESSPTRSRQILTTDAQNGLFRWNANSVNLYTLANSNGFTNTPDPTTTGILTMMRNATAGTGAFSAGSSPNRQTYTFVNQGSQIRKFLAFRFDVNLGKNHSLENVLNKQPFRSTADFLNSLDPVYPGLTNGGAQNSDRWSNSTALRSSLGQNIVNEARYSRLWGTSGFTLLGGLDYFNTSQGRYIMGINPAALGINGYVARPAISFRTTPTYDFTDTVTWIKGAHTFSFGGQYKMVKTKATDVLAVAPTVGLGLATGDPAAAMFNTTNFPGASTAQLNEAAALYAVLTGRISSYTETARLEASGQYKASGTTYRVTKQKTYGAFFQDTWRFRPNLTLNLGLRWQPQTGYILGTENFTELENFNQVYDVSGPGNLFTPGTLTGTVPRAIGLSKGSSAFETSWKNFAPSVGVVWSPEFAKGFLHTLFGDSGRSVFRGGFSRAFIREGTLLPTNTLGINPGGFLSASRSTTLGNLTVGTLFRTPGNVNITPAPFPASPTYPLALTAADNAVAFSPDLKTGFVDSWTIGYQRELDKDTVVEFRYVGNRGKEMLRYYNLNEVNTIENGFASEFALAQSNLLANEAAFAGGDQRRRYCPAFEDPVTFQCRATSNPASATVARLATFGFYGAGTGTVALPIFYAYFGASSNPANINNPANYTTANTTIAGRFGNATFVNPLTPVAPNLLGLASSLENNFRANGAAAGKPLNFFNNCPTTLGFCFLVDNSEISEYDSGVVEIRRRLSNGLRIQASYVYAKAFTNAFAGATSLGGVGVADQNNNSSVTLRNPDLDRSEAQVDLRHAFKFDATYDLPFGKGRQFAGNSSWGLNALIGGWSIAPVLRWQSGSPILMENVQLVGMTKKELQKAINVYKDSAFTNTVLTGGVTTAVTFLPVDIIENTIKAFSVTATGYANGAPTGRFIAPAGYNNCYNKSPGQCGFRKLVLFGPSFFKLDAALIKKVQFDEKRNIEFRATFFDVLNRTNWRIGGWTANVSNLAAGGAAFGQLSNTSGTAYQDPFGSNDPGGRIIDLSFRFNF